MVVVDEGDNDGCMVWWWWMGVIEMLLVGMSWLGGTMVVVGLIVQ